MTGKTKEYLKKLASLVDRHIDRYLPGSGEEPKSVHRAMRYSVFSGGKRIRPILTLESAKLFGAKPKDAIVAASAVELVHTYSLIHDDLPSMDDDDYRRGKPSCHKRFTEATAVLAGDALLTHAFGLIAEKLNPKVSAGVSRELAYFIGTRGMIGGQALDIELKDVLKDRKTLDEINYLKTAMLFHVSMKMGAIVAGAAKLETALIGRYGTYLGMAFQVADDVIDNEGYAEALGVKKAYAYCEFLTKKAKDSLSVFGKKADRLKEIADHISGRKA